MTWRGRSTAREPSSAAPGAAAPVRRAVVLYAVVLCAAAGPGLAAAEAPPGAASCSGCHSPRPGVGAAVPGLGGLDADAIAAAMAAYRTGERASTVMGRIARGFSDEESRAIAAWLAAGSRP